MAVLTGISDAVRAGIAGAAGQAVKAGGNAIRNIAGLNVEGSNSALASTFGLNKRTNSSILTYPIDVDSDPQQGHFIMFMINERIPGRLAQNKGKSIESAKKKLMAQGNFPNDVIGNKTGDPPLTKEELAAQQLSLDLQASAAAKNVDSVPKGKLNRNLTEEKIPVNKNVATISLYMPPSVSVTYEVKYADQKIGSLAAVGSAAIDAFKAGTGTKDTLTKIGDALTSATAKEGLLNLANSSLDAFAPGALALSQLERGTAITPRMEMMFEGVGRRSFTYTFSFLPKSVQEARLVEDIIYHFKFYAMPRYTNETTRREMDIPGTFDIQYMYRENRNSFLNRVSTCFLQNVAVEYGADRFTAYEETTGKRGKGPPPQKSKLTLNFVELEVLSQDHIEQGF